MMSYRPVRAGLTLPPCPQHLSHRKNSKSDATVEGGWAKEEEESIHKGRCNPIWFCLVDFFTSSSKRKRSSSEKKIKEKEEEKHYGEPNNPTILTRP
jgi:hypothetical protein